MDMFEKLKILTDAAKYDVACTSSGSDRRGRQGVLGNAVAAGICHSFAADGRCISLLKVLLSNDCAFDCAYCVNRRSAECRRATFTPEELCSLTMEFYRRNYIEGLFLSSAVVGSPDATCERMLAVLKTLRERCRFATRSMIVMPMTVAAMLISEVMAVMVKESFSLKPTALHSEFE